MQGPLAVFVDFYTGGQQIVIQHGGNKARDGHVRLALQDQPDLDAALGSMAKVAQKAIARKKISVGQSNTVPGRPYPDPIVQLYVVTMAVVVTDNQCGRAIPMRPAGLSLTAAQAAPGELGAHRRQDLRLEFHDLVDQRAADRDGVVLLGSRAKLDEMVRTEINTADKSQCAVHHHDLAMHTAEQIGAHPQTPRLRIKNMKAHPYGGHGRNVVLRQVGRAVAIHRNVNSHAARSRLDDDALQLLADFVLENNEGFQNDAAFGLADGLEDGGKEFLAVLQQLQRIARCPPYGHSVSSTASGA